VHIVVQVRVVVGAAIGTATNTATVAATSTDPNPANNTDQESIDVTGAQSSPPTNPAVGSGAPTPQLPRTGNSSLGGPLTLASLLVAGGMFSLMIARRRRAVAAQ
jgi:LPXTG-motif cell wall-anchored protein